MSEDHYREAYEREKRARLLAEKLGEELIRRVYDQNHELETINEDLKRNQQTLVQQEKMASVGVLASGIAHEINNPLGYSLSNLSVLRGYIESLEIFYSTLKDWQGLPEELVAIINDDELAYIISDMPSLARESISGLESVKEIVTDLRGFSRSGEGNTVSTDVNECMRTTLRVLRSELKYGVVDADYGSLPLVIANPGKLNQVFANLILNAAQAMDGPGKIVVRTGCDQSCVSIAISDDGPGIPDEIQGKIFDPFFTTKPVGKGTGLGLAICYTIIVEEHAGEISVSNSVEGKGATFVVKLPLIAAG